MTGSSTVEKDIPGLGKIRVQKQPLPLLAAGYSLANCPAPTSKEDMALNKHFDELTPSEEKLERVIGSLTKKVNIEKTTKQVGL